jgi:hypothetical protein
MCSEMLLLLLALFRVLDTGSIIADDITGVPLLFLPELHTAELTIAKRLHDIAHVKVCLYFAPFIAGNLERKFRVSSSSL